MGRGVVWWGGVGYGGTALLSGDHYHALDAKNRLTIPKAFRSALAEGLVVTRAPDRCLEVYPTAGWEEKVQNAVPDGPLTTEERQYQRLMLHRAVPGELDSVGRIVLNDRLLQHAGITRDVVVAGTGTYLEVWDREAFEAQDEQNGANAVDLANAVALARR